ncbi:MAG TPA: HypC/HybG/HupF family hydrogenase formation chaperone [Gaiellaceae bacterium]|nr:HypC/HybG/HupF family hydrogenase formation chaperone [Gaiellaceae bacterium]
MCIGAPAVLVEVRDEDGARSGRLADGRVVSLAFLPGAEAGDTVLLHLGIPVEVLEPSAPEPEGAVR